MNNAYGKYINCLILCLFLFASKAYAQALPEFDIIKSCGISVGLGEGVSSSEEKVCIENEITARARVNSILADNNSISPDHLKHCLFFSKTYHNKPLIISKTKHHLLVANDLTPKSLGSYVLLERCLLIPLPCMLDNQKLKDCVETNQRRR